MPAQLIWAEHICIHPCSRTTAVLQDGRAHLFRAHLHRKVPVLNSANWHTLKSSFSEVRPSPTQYLALAAYFLQKDLQ